MVALQELPHVNVLSKIDMIEQFGKTDFNLEYYTDVLDLDFLLDRLNQVGFRVCDVPKKSSTATDIRLPHMYYASVLPAFRIPGEPSSEN